MGAFEDALAALAIKFRERCAREGDELKALIAQDRLYEPRVRTIVHGLAGTGGSFGFDAVSARARAVELDLEGRNVQPADLDRLYAALAACEQTPPQ